MEKVMIDGFPRRNRIDHNTETELEIRKAVEAIEKLPADERLTEAVILIGQALDKVSDYEDEQILKSK